MTLSSKQKAILHVAKGKLGLSDADYRAALVHIAGATSSTEMDIYGFNAVMGYFEYLGFKPLDRQGADYGTRPGMASFAQIELIRVLWREYTRDKAGEAELSKWVMGTWKVSSLRFLKKEQAQKAIAALKMMKARTASA